MKKLSVFVVAKSWILLLGAVCVILLLADIYQFLQLKKPVIDKDYLMALNTADRFLYAWVMRDGLTAYDLVTDNIKKGCASPMDFQRYFAGLSNPHHEAFEIDGGTRNGENRICFKVWLYEYYTGTTPPPYKRRKPSRIELVKVGKDTWRVDQIT